MTNQVIAQTRVQSDSRQPTGWKNVFHNWFVRRQVRALQDRSDAILDDIGVTRDEVAWAAELPLNTNAARELEQAAYRRRKEQQLKWL